MGRDTLHRLERLVTAGLRRARSTGEVTLVSATGRTGAGTDPTAVVAASRRAGEEWFCFEQPDRDGSAVAALGRVRSLEASGPRRFAEVDAAWRELVAASISDTPAGPPGSGLVARGASPLPPTAGRARAGRASPRPR